MEWALSEERKEESELALKNEIKFLINKLVSINNGNANNVSVNYHDVSQIAKNCLNRSNIDIHSSFVNNNNTSALLNHSQIHTPINYGSFVSPSNAGGVDGQTHLAILHNNLSDMKPQNHHHDTYSTDRKPLGAVSRNLNESDFKENMPTASKRTDMRSPKSNNIFG